MRYLRLVLKLKVIIQRKEINNIYVFKYFSTTETYLINIYYLFVTYFIMFIFILFLYLFVFLF